MQEVSARWLASTWNGTTSEVSATSTASPDLSTSIYMTAIACKAKSDERKIGEQGQRL